MEGKKQNTKNEVFIMRLSENDKTRLKAKAQEQNLSVSSYVRSTILKNTKDETT